MNVSIRRASPEDLDFLVALLNHEEVDPFLAAGRHTDPESLTAEIERGYKGHLS